MLGTHERLHGPSGPDVLRSPLEAALEVARTVRGRVRERGLRSVRVREAEAPRELLHVPDVGPTCEVLLADRLFHDLHDDERRELLAFVRASQSEDGSWPDVHGAPSLSLTVLGFWARRDGGDDPHEDSMVRARRAVHAMGGAQRADFSVRLWLAMAGLVPWSYLPVLPGELFLVPEPTWLSLSRVSPWARGMLTPYYIIAHAPARLQLADVSSLLLERRPETPVPPRLTRPGLAGDLLQAFDRSVRLSRKLPRGPLRRWALQRAEARLLESQQQHGGWFSFRPTVLGLIALRVLGVRTDDERLRRGLEHLRRSRGRVVLRYGQARGQSVLAQGLSTPPLEALAPLLDGDPSGLGWLLRQELSEPGPWQARADAPAGGWPREAGAGHHLDVAATCQAVATLAGAHEDSTLAAASWASRRRAIEVLLAMQEADGGFSRFERGEADVLLRKLPWRDADLLAFGRPDDLPHIRVSAMAVAELGRAGFRIEDDRIARAIAWLSRHAADPHDHGDVTTLTSLGEGLAAVTPRTHALRNTIELRLRARQREDGSFGTLVDTARAIKALIALSEPCVQTSRAVRHVVEAITRHGEAAFDVAVPGNDPDALDPSAAAREIPLALAAFQRAGGFF